MSDSTPYNMPKEPGRWRAILLAAFVHAALFGLLWFGIRWQSETPIAVEAEVWDLQPQEAAPRPQPEPKPEPQPAPKPEPAPQPVIKETPPAPPVVEKLLDTPDIALEQEKKRIEEKKRLEEEKRREQERQEKARQEKERQEKARQEKEREEKERQQKIAEQKAEEKRIEKERQEKLAAEAKKKAEAEELKKRQAAEKAAAEKLRRERLEAEEREAEKRHQENLARMADQAAGTGSAPRTQGGRADADYIGRVAAKIKSNTIFNVPDLLSGNPPVEYEVQLLPDGSLRGVRKIRSSGVPGFDEAVARAIERSTPFPPDRSGTVPSSFNVIHRPKDQ